MNPPWWAVPCLALTLVSTLFGLCWIIIFLICLLSILSSFRLSLCLSLIHPSWLAQWLAKKRCVRFQELMNKLGLLDLFWRPRALCLKSSRNQAQDDFVSVQNKTFLFILVVKSTPFESSFCLLHAGADSLGVPSSQSFP